MGLIDNIWKKVKKVGSSIFSWENFVNAMALGDNTQQAVRGIASLQDYRRRQRAQQAEDAKLKSDVRAREAAAGVKFFDGSRDYYQKMNKVTGYNIPAYFFKTMTEEGYQVRDPKTGGLKSGARELLLSMNKPELTDYVEKKTQEFQNDPQKLNRKLNAKLRDVVIMNNKDAAGVKEILKGRDVSQVDDNEYLALLYALAKAALEYDLDGVSDIKESYRKDWLGHAFDFLSGAEAPKETLRDLSKKFLKDQSETPYIKNVINNKALELKKEVVDPNSGKSYIDEFDDLASQLSVDYKIALSYTKDEKGNIVIKNKDFAWMKDYGRLKDTEVLQINDDEKRRLFSKYQVDSAMGGETYANKQLMDYFQDKMEKGLSEMDMGGWLEVPAMFLDSVASLGIGAVGVTAGILEAGTRGVAGEEDAFNRIFDNDLVKYSNDLMETHVYDTDAQKKLKELGISDNQIFENSEEEGALFNAKTIPNLLGQYGFTAGTTIMSFGGTAAAQGAIKGSLWAMKAMGAANKATRWNKMLKFAAKSKDVLNLINGGIIATAEGAQIAQSDKETMLLNFLDRNDNLYIDDIFKQAGNNRSEDFSICKAAVDNAASVLGVEADAVDQFGTKLYSKTSLNAIKEGIMQNPDLKKQFLEPYKNKHANQISQDSQEAEDMAGDAAAADFLFQSTINGVINMALKSTLHSKSVLNAKRHVLDYLGFKGKNNVLNHVDIVQDVKTNGWKALAKKSTAKQLMWERTKESIGEGLEEYIQDVGSGFGTGYGDSLYEEYLDVKRGNMNATRDAIHHSMATAIAHGLSYAADKAVDVESLRDGVYGFLSSALGGYNINQNFNGFKNTGDATGNKLSQVMNRIPVSWRAVWTLPFNNSEKAARQDYNNRMAERLNNFFSNEDVQQRITTAEGVASFLKEYQTAIASGNEFKARNAKFGLDFSAVIMLNSLKGTTYYDSVMKSLDLREAVGKDTELIKKMLENPESDASKLLREIKTQLDYKTGDKKKDYDFSATDENVEIVRKAVQNAEEMKQLMSDVDSTRNQIERDFGGEIDDDGIEAMTYERLAIKNRKERHKQINDDLLKVMSFDVDKQKQNSLASATARYGSYANASQRVQDLTDIAKELKEKLEDKSVKQRIDELEERYAARLAFSKSNRKNNGKKQASFNLSTEDSELLMYYTQLRAMYEETNKQLTQAKKDQAALEKDILKQIRTITSDKAVGSEEWGKEIQEKEKAVREQHTAPVLSAREIMELGSDARAYMLDPLNLGKYSEEQLRVITQLVNSGTEVYGKDWQTKLRDAASLEESIASETKKMNDLMNNPVKLAQYTNRIKMDNTRREELRKGEPYFVNAINKIKQGGEENASEELELLAQYLSTDTTDNGIQDAVKRELLKKYANSQAVQILNERGKELKDFANAVSNMDVLIYRIQRGNRQITKERDLQPEDKRLLDFVIDYATPRAIPVSQLVGRINEDFIAYVNNVSLRGKDDGIKNILAEGGAIERVRSLTQAAIDTYNHDKKVLLEINESKPTTAATSTATQEHESKPNPKSDNKQDQQKKDEDNPPAADSQKDDSPAAAPMTEQQQQEVTNQFIQSLNDAGVPIEMLSPEEILKFLAEHGEDEDLRFMSELLGTAGSENPTQSPADIQKELDSIKEQAIANGTFMKAPNGKPTKLDERQWLHVRTKAFKKWFGDWINDPENASKVVDENGEPKVMYHATPWGNFNKFQQFQPNTGDRTRPGELYFGNSAKMVERYKRGDFNKGMRNPHLYEVFLNIRNPYKNSEPISNKEELNLELNKFKLLLTPEEFKTIKNSVLESFKLYNETGSTYHTYNIYTALSKYFKENNQLRFYDVIKNLIENGYNDGMFFLTKDEWEGQPVNFREDVKKQVWVMSPNQIKSATDNIGTYSTTDDNILRNVVSESEYNDLLFELSMSADKTDSFLHNFLDKVLGVNPRLKVDTMRDDFAYSTLLRNTPNEFNEKLFKKIFGYKTSFNKYSTREEFIEDVRKALDNWGSNLIDIINNPPLQDRAISLQKDRGKVINRIQKLRSSLTLGTSTNRRKTGLELKKAYEELRQINNTIIVNNYQRHALLLAAKNRLVALNTIPNIKDLVEKRLLAEYDSRTVSEEEFKRLVEPKRELFDAIRKVLSSKDVDRQSESLFNEDTQREISFTELSSRISKTNPEFNALLELFKNANPNLKIKVGGTPERVLQGTAAGKFSPRENTLYLSNVADVYTTIHELAHSATYYGIVGRTKTQGPFKEQIGKFMNYVRDYIRSEKMNPRLFESASIFRVSMPAKVYGFTNSSEFIAELFGNPAFQEMLSVIPPMKNKEFKSLLHQVWNSIVDFLSNLSGGKRLNKNALDQAKKLGYAAMALQQQHINEVYAQLNEMTGENQSNIVTDNVGTFSTTNNDIRFMKTPDGEIYGFTYNGKIYIDKTKIKPDVPIHEYTHLWDIAILQASPELWARGVKLLKEKATELWNQILNDDNYGKKWTTRGITGEQLDDLIASECHARMASLGYRKVLKQSGVDRSTWNAIKQWLLDCYRNLARTLGMSHVQIKALTLDDWNNLPVRDFMNAVNPYVDFMSNKNNVLNNQYVVRYMEKILPELETLLDAIERMNINNYIKKVIGDKIIDLTREGKQYDTIKELQSDLFTALLTEPVTIPYASIIRKVNVANVKKTQSSLPQSDEKADDVDLADIKFVPRIESLDLDYIMNLDDNDSQKQYIKKYSFIPNVKALSEYIQTGKVAKNKIKVVFIYAPKFAEGVKTSMGVDDNGKHRYDQAVHAPIVMAVQITPELKPLVESEKHSNVIAIPKGNLGNEDLGTEFLPIGLMPANDNQYSEGAVNMTELRTQINNGQHNVSDEPHLLEYRTISGTGKHGSPIVTSIEVINDHAEDGERPEVNVDTPRSDATSLMVKNLIDESEHPLVAIKDKAAAINKFAEASGPRGSKKAIRNTEIWKAGKRKFISLLKHIPKTEARNKESRVDFMVQKGTRDQYGRILLTKKISETVSRNSNELIVDMLRRFNGNNATETLSKEIIESNSRFRRLFSKWTETDKQQGVPFIVTPLLGNLSPQRVQTVLSNLSESLKKDIKNSFSFGKNNKGNLGIDLLEVKTELDDDSVLVTVVYNGTELSNIVIPLNGKVTHENFVQFIKGLILDSDGETRPSIADSNSELVKWQFNHNDVDVANTKSQPGETKQDREKREHAHHNLEDLYDDGIWELQTNKLVYPAKSVVVNIPTGRNADALYNQRRNGDKPIQQSPVVRKEPPKDPDSGVGSGDEETHDDTKKDDNTVEYNGIRIPKRAMVAIKKILRDGESRNLDEDDDSHYVIDNESWARVTSIKSALEEFSFSRFNKDNAWGLPSTRVGNSFDEFARDVLNGKFDGMTEEERKEAFENYDNSTKENYKDVYQKLKAFEATLASKGRCVVRTTWEEEEGGKKVKHNSKIVAKGVLNVVVNQNGKRVVKQVRVAGTLDLLVVDTAGNFHVYDFKTFHSKTLDEESAKKNGYDVQTGMYGLFLEDEYGKDYGVTVASTNIIPALTPYPRPFGLDNNLKPITTPERYYSVKNDKDNQLYVQTKAQHEKGVAPTEFHGAKYQVKEPFSFKEKMSREKLVVDYSKMTDDERQALVEEIQSQNPEVEIKSAEQIESVSPQSPAQKSTVRVNDRTKTPIDDSKPAAKQGSNYVIDNDGFREQESVHRRRRRSGVSSSSAESTAGVDKIVSDSAGIQTKEDEQRDACSKQAVIER